MIPDEELTELKDRISQKSDRELLQIVEVEYDDYRPEAIEFAKAELTKRFVPFEEPEISSVDPDDETSDEIARPAANAAPCAKCGGPTRPALLFADKELTILFSDDNEERFVQVFACTRCGELRLTVDFATDVEG
jgi:hypothetical protein